MTLKNKEISKLFDAVELYYYDTVSLPSVMTDFMACDDAIEGEISALKSELRDANGNVDHLRSVALERGDKLSKANNQIDELKEDLKESKNEIEALKKKIHELEKENANLRVPPAYANDTCMEDLSYDHKFEFGDKVLVPWSDVPYMYIKTSLMYNPRTKSLVYVGKTQHLKWFGERFEIK